MITDAFSFIMNGAVITAIVWCSIAVAIVVIMIILLLVAVTVRRNAGMVFRYHRNRNTHWPPFYRPQLADSLELVKCQSCSGGTQWLHPDDGWGKIPRHMLFRRWNASEEDWDCNDQIFTNLRRCNRCAGRGFTYRDKVVVTENEDPRL